MSIRAAAFLLPLPRSATASTAGRCLVAQIGWNATSATTGLPPDQTSWVAVDFCVLVDCSWFMQKETLPTDAQGDKGLFCTKLEAAKSSIESLLGALPESYTLSLMAFGDSVTCCATRMIRGQESSYRKTVAALAGGARSHLAVGLNAAGQLLLSGPTASHKKIVLIHGSQVRHAGAAILAAEGLARKGVQLDVICLGADSNRLLAQQLVCAGNGRTWLATTGVEANAAVQSALQSSLNTVAHGVVASVDVGIGWGIRACVREGTEHLPLYCSSTDLPSRKTVHLGGLSADDVVDLFFYLEPLCADSSATGPRCELTITDASGSDALQVNTGNMAPQDAGEIAPDEVQRLMRNRDLLAIKFGESLLYLAHQRGDCGSVLQHLMYLQTQSQSLGLTFIEQLVVQLAQNYQRNSDLPTDVLNNLISHTSSLPIEAVSLPVRAESLLCGPVPAFEERTDSLSSPAPLADDGAIRTLLDLCRESLAALEELSSDEPSKADAAGSEGRHTQPPDSQPLPCVVEDFFSNLAGESEKQVMSVELAARELIESLREAPAVLIQLRHLRERNAAMDRTLRMAIECAMFYGWCDAGWMNSIDSLRLRGTMLSHLLESK